MDREGRRLGVARQREHCIELERRIGVTVVDEFCDNDRSASTLSTKKRPQFDAMTTAAERGDYAVITSYSTSRLTRRPMEIERIIPLGERYGVKIHTVKHGDYDLNSARGRRRAREDAARDAEEVEEMSERLRDEVVQRAAQGRYHGGRKGYGFDGADVVEAEAAQIRAWAARLVAGGSLHSIARELNEDGVPAAWGGRWHPGVIRRILLNPRVGGLRILHGAEYPAPNPPIVPVETWRAVERVLTEPGRRLNESTARKHIGAGLFFCERCAPQKVISNRHLRGHLVYKCPTCARSWKADPIHEWLEQRVERRLARGDVADLLPRAAGVDLAALDAERVGAKKRLAQLSVAFADEAIDAEQLRVGTERLRERIRAIDAQVADAGRVGPLGPLVSADDPVAAYKDIKDLDRRRAVWTSLMVVVLGESPRGRAPWDPSKVLPGSRWVGDTKTWGEYWGGAS